VLLQSVLVLPEVYLVICDGFIYQSTIRLSSAEVHLWQQAIMIRRRWSKFAFVKCELQLPNSFKC